MSTISTKPLLICQGSKEQAVHIFKHGGPIIQRKVLAIQENCIPPSIEDFPRDLFTQNDRMRGAVVFHIIAVVYMCGILAYVCDDYFVPSLEILSEILKVPTDVAGATFMAVGTSAPELFSSVIGVFITEGDIGVGTIVGSAVFNILGVTSLVGLAVWKKDVEIDWFPITRDCLMYAASVTALIIVIHNNVVVWYEAMILILMFVFYCLVMFFNASIEQSSNNFVNRFFTVGSGDEQKPLLDSRVDVEACGLRKSSFGSLDDIVDRRRRQSSSFSQLDSFERHKIESELVSASVSKMEETAEESDASLWSMPVGPALTQISWVLFWIPRFLLYITIPDCRKATWRMWFPVTFVMSVVWIGAASYVAVWMVTVIGYTWGIPDTVMGITVLAAGTSIPEVISSVIVAKTGLGNMAICNLLGSNIFDILFCLGMPWFIKTMFFSSSGSLEINSSGLTYTSITLLTTVVLLFVTFAISKWKLNYKVGFICLILYLGFITLAMMYELNFFGDFNPPQCESAL